MALVLSGGGARGAFQAGVVRALYEITSQCNRLEIFRTIAGVSAGSINVSILASQADQLDKATQKLCEVWRNLQAEDVFKTDYTSVTRNAFKLMRGVSLGGISAKLRPIAVGLLNTAPLRELLSQSIEFDKIEDNITKGLLDAVSVSATDYSTSLGVSFVQGKQPLKVWQTANRTAVISKLTVDHVMASSAIPLFFPPIEVEGRYYGDGCLRNTAPLSPAVHLGAEKILVIGVRRWRPIDLAKAPVLQPSMGRVLSVLTNAIFMDAIEVDLERLQIINQTIKLINEASATKSPFRPIDALYIQPSVGLSDIAQTRENDLPKVIRFLMAGLGTSEEASEILSYLLFEPGYCNALVDLGYNDTMAKKEEIISFLA